MARHPLAGQGFELLGCRFGVFVLAAVALHAACLFTHARAEQRMFVGKRDTDAVAIVDLAAPRHISRVAGAGAQRGYVQIDRSALAPGPWPMAGDAAQAVGEQTLAGDGRGGTLC